MHENLSLSSAKAHMLSLWTPLLPKAGGVSSSQLLPYPNMTVTMMLHASKLHFQFLLLSKL